MSFPQGPGNGNNPNPNNNRNNGNPFTNPVSYTHLTLPTNSRV